MKKVIIFSVILIGLFIIICFCIGYKIPQKDTHPDWPEFPKHTNTSLIIESNNLSITHYTEIPGTDNFLIYYRDEKSVDQYSIMTKTCKIKHNFGSFNSGIVIDTVHNLLITAHFVNNDTTKYLAYNSKTFKPVPISAFKFGVPQSFDVFLDRERGVDKNNYKGGTDRIIEYKPGETKEILKEKYKTKYSKFSAFLNSLGDIYDFNENTDGYQNISYIKCSKEGNLYVFSYDDQQSIEILCPGFYNDKYRNRNREEGRNLSIADSSTIRSNDFNLNMAFYPTGTPTGNGGAGHFKPHFSQNYRYYNTLKLKNIATNFKGDSYSFTQFNIPKNDADTLAFTFEGRLYKMYKRK